MQKSSTFSLWTVAFWTLRLHACSSASVALLSGSCSSGREFAMASSPLHLTVQSLPVTIGFVGNYVLWNFHPSFGTCPSYMQEVRSFPAGLLSVDQTWVYPYSPLYMNLLSAEMFVSTIKTRAVYIPGSNPSSDSIRFLMEQLPSVLVRFQSQS